MKKALLVLTGLVLLSGPALQAKEDSKPSLEKFYGKVVKVNASKKMVTVYNKKRKREANFKWDDQTKILFKKASFNPKNLKVDQFLIVSYVPKGSAPIATRITVRAPFKRKKKDT